MECFIWRDRNTRIVCKTVDFVHYATDICNKQCVVTVFCEYSCIFSRLCLKFCSVCKNNF